MSLRQAAFSAGRWTTASLLARALLQIAQTMILARLLTPADFGQMAVIGAVYAIVSLFVDLGLSNALIHFPHPSRSALSTLYWLNLGAASLVMLFLMALSWPFARLYHEPALLSAMTAMSLAMPLSAIGQQFRVMAEKELRFSVLAVNEVVAALSGFTAALITAGLHGGVYSLIVAILVSAATSSAMAWLLLSDNLRPDFHFNLGDVKSYLHYGSYRLGDTLFNSIQSQADVLIGGAITGASAMGVYTLPRDLTQRLASTVVNPVVTRVGLPVMARLQNDRAVLRSVYLQTLRMTSSINFPVYAAMAIWADEAVTVLLGPQWQHAGTYMRLFAIWGMIRSTGNPVGSLLYATGRVRRAFWWNFSLLCVTPGILFLGAKIGSTSGLATTMIGIQVMVFYPAYRLLVAPACGASFREYVGELLPPFVASLVAVTLGFLVSSLFPQNVYTRIISGGSTSILAYLIASYVFNKPWTVAMSELLTPMLGRTK